MCFIRKGYVYCSIEVILASRIASHLASVIFVDHQCIVLVYYVRVLS